MKARTALAALALPLLLIIPQGASAQGLLPPPDCTVDSLSVSIFDAAPLGCGGVVVLDLPTTQAEALKNAQERWDRLALQIGKTAVTRWLGQRPKVLADLWWIGLPVG